MTAGRSARTSVEALTRATAPDGQVARSSVEVLTKATAPDAQVARISVEVLVKYPTENVSRWGVPWK